MTAAELQTFAETLEAWGRGLSVKEQAFLLEILARAAAEDVRGHSLQPSWPSTSDGMATQPADGASLERTSPGIAALLEPLHAIAAQRDRFNGVYLVQGVTHK